MSGKAKFMTVIMSKLYRDYNPLLFDAQQKISHDFFHITCFL